MASRRELDALLLHEPAELGFREAVRLIQDRIRHAGEADEAGSALMDQGDPVQARARYEEGVELAEWSLGREAEMWRVVLKDLQKTASIYAEPIVSARCLGSRKPDARVHVAFSKGDWVRLHSDEGWGEEPAWMIINRSGAVKNTGIQLEPELSVHWRNRARELYLSLRLGSARACLAMGDWTSAALSATAALLYDEHNADAILLRAIAHTSLDSETRVEEARDDLERLAQLQPENGELQEHLKRAEDRLRELRKEQDLREAIAKKEQLEEEARLRDLSEVQELRRSLRKSADERQQLRAEEEAAALAMVAVPGSGSSGSSVRRGGAAASALEEGAASALAPARSLGSLALLAQVSRLASQVPRAAIQDPLEDGGASEPGGSRDALAMVPVFSRGFGTRAQGRGLGARGRGFGRGIGAPGGVSRAVGPQPADRAAKAPAASSSLHEAEVPQHSAYPLPSGPPASAGQSTAATSTELAPSAPPRKYAATAKKELLQGGRRSRATHMDRETSGEIEALRKELRQVAAEKAHAIAEEDFKRAGALKQQHAALATKVQEAELRAKDQASAQLQQLRVEMRELEASVREAAEAGRIDHAVELRQQCNRLKAEVRRLAWIAEA